MDRYAGRISLRAEPQSNVNTVISVLGGFPEAELKEFESQIRHELSKASEDVLTYLSGPEASRNPSKTIFAVKERIF